MRTYYQYLPSDQLDTDWGMQIITGGHSQFMPGQPYPDANHPSGHAFTWNKGRVLAGYYLVYITQGRGVFEADGLVARPIDAGTLLFLYPGVWHRYKPDSAVGWDEYWVGFRGSYPDLLMHQPHFTSVMPCLSVGCHTQLVNVFQQLLDVIKARPVGYQPILVGLTVQLLGVIYSLIRQQDAPGSRTEDIMERAKFLLRERAEESLDVAQFAQDLGVGYAWFRKAFKQVTGQSPLQYLIEIKINRAKELLKGTRLTVNEVAYHLNFSSPLYFSRLFRQKTGVTPIEFRNNS